MSDEPKLDAAKRPSGLRAMADGMIYLAGQTGVETANVWQVADILRTAADEMQSLKRERDETREQIRKIAEYLRKYNHDDAAESLEIFLEAAK